MEQTLQALGGILLKAIPTILIVLVVHFYLKRMLFRPLERVLHERDEVTAGARKLADRAFAHAEQKAAEYEAALRQARAEAFREQETIRRSLLDEQNQQVEAARARTSEMVRSAKQQIEQDAEAARRGLAETAASLADQIAAALLSGGYGGPEAGNTVGVGGSTADRGQGPEGRSRR